MTRPHEKERRLAECFERGRHLAAVERNYDYAHAMFTECLSQSPGTLEYAEALIANLKTKFGNDKKAARHLFRVQGVKEFTATLGRENWLEALRLGLDVLKADPWHVRTLRGMASACEALHFNEVELVYLKQALEAAPKDLGVNRHCARSLARMGQYDQAIVCWHRVEEIHQHDHEATEMISRLAAEKMTYPGGKPPGANKKAEQTTTDSEANVSEVERELPSAAQAEIPLLPRQRLERAIEADPADVSNYLKLTELLCEVSHYENAERTLLRALDHCAQRQLIEDALEVVRTKLAEAKREAEAIARQRESRAQQNGVRIPWIEFVLAAAGVALLFQIVPSWWNAVLEAIWANAQVLLIAGNVMVLLGLILWYQWKRQSS